MKQFYLMGKWGKSYKSARERADGNLWEERNEKAPRTEVAGLGF